MVLISLLSQNAVEQVQQRSEEFAVRLASRIASTGETRVPQSFVTSHE